jgi:hypothetical protein
MGSVRAGVLSHAHCPVVAVRRECVARAADVPPALTVVGE